jgi:hypothetical protein
LVLVCFLRRTSFWAWLGCAFLVAVTLFQYHLRLHIGFIPMHYRWGCWPWVACHYVLMLFFPFVTSPVFPAGFYPLLEVGAVAIALWAAISWRSLGVALLVLSPVFAASVTESFWFGARYALLFDICVLFFVGRFASRFFTWRAYAGLAACVALSAVLVRGQDIFAVGNLGCLTETVSQAETLGANCLVYKIVLGHLSSGDISAIKRRPELAKFLPQNPSVFVRTVH